MITLTVKGWRGEDLEHAKERLDVAFEKLRHREIWVDRVEGAIASCETTGRIDQGVKLWHYHIHLIYDGQYIARNALVDAWKEITGDSFIVDIRAVRDREGAVAELAKYPFKPAEVDGWSDKMRVEYECTMSGRRLYRTYGTFYGHKLKLVPNRTHECRKCGAVNSLVVEILASEPCFEPDLRAVLTMRRASPSPWGPGGDFGDLHR